MDGCRQSNAGAITESDLGNKAETESSSCRDAAELPDPIDFFYYCSYQDVLFLEHVKQGSNIAMTTPIHITFAIIIGFSSLCCGTVAFADEVSDEYDDSSYMIDDDETLTEDDSELIEDGDELLTDDDSELIDEEMTDDAEVAFDGENDEPMAEDDSDSYDEEMGNNDEAMLADESDEPMADDDPESYNEEMTGDDEIAFDSGDEVSPMGGNNTCAKTLKITVNAQAKWKLEPAGVKAIHRFSIITFCNNSNTLLEIGFVPTTYIASGTNFEIEPYDCKLFHVDKPKSVPAQKFSIKAILGPAGFTDKSGFVICK